MSYLRGLTKAGAQILLSASLVWAVTGCADSMQDDVNVASQVAALEVAGSGGGSAPMAPPDEIVGPFTKELNGLSLVYRYSHGGDYFITYGKDTVTFRLPLPNGQHTPPITVPYFARSLRGNLTMVHWVNPERTVHVTQVVDLAKREVHVAALMPGQWQLFDIGKISQMSRTKPK